MPRLIAWFVDNPVAANLLMLILVVGGLLMLPQIRKEEFPNVDTDYVQITVPYRGAAPEEVEKGVCIRIEEAIRGLEGIRKINTAAMEGLCNISVELFHDANKSKALDDINARVYSISTFPRETERPVVTEVTVTSTVMEITISGPTDERALKELAEEVREELTEDSRISQVEVLYARPYEISIEISEQQLRRHGLTFERVAEAIRDASLDVPGGSLKSDEGEILLRSKGQLYAGREFEDVVVLKRADGTALRLGEIATVVDGFEDTDLRVRFDGNPAVMLRISRIGDEDTLEIARAVKAYLARKQDSLPSGIALVISRDESQDLVDRLDALLGNAFSGFVLVVLILALFLRLRVALWVSAGIPIAILGALALFPVVGLTISSLSLMGFLLVLGIVVDDATVVGERIHAYQTQGMDARSAAIRGTSEVSIPVIFGVLTTMAAFLPIITIRGNLGSFFAAVGVTVILCLSFSLVESQLILPSHLAHRRARRTSAQREGRVAGIQDAVSNWLERLIANHYNPLMLKVVEYRYLVCAIGLGCMIVMGGMIAGERIVFQYFPSVEGDRLYATLTMPEGTSAEVTQRAARRLESSAERLRERLDQGRSAQESVVLHTMTSVGKRIGRGTLEFGGSEGSNYAEVLIELAPYRERGGMNSTEAAGLWRDLTARIPDALELAFTAEAFSAGKPIDIQLRGRDVAQLGAAAAELRATLQSYDGVFDLSDTFRAGKQEVLLAIRPEAELLGLSQRDLGTQVRQAFYGEEAQRVQRGRDDVRVMVRFPEAERASLGDLENLRIRTAEGAEVPSLSVARMVLGRGYSTINRVDGQRVISVRGDVDRSVNTPERVLASIAKTELPRIAERYPGISFALAGEAEDRAEAMKGLGEMSLMALLIIYALLAIPLRSYLQPLVIMSAIPFGFIGALLGHLLMGIDLVFFSLLGIVALSGVVVNASLVLVDYVNQQRRSGMELVPAVLRAGAVRFRPILLTSATTFFGLAPLMATANVSTTLFVPMAVSLGFGVLFATGVTLLLVPALYLIVDDFLRWARRHFAADAAAEQLERAAAALEASPGENSAN
ncbi:MAG: efflux RND transporter permease subunit [Pseudomonadales bacterium]|nr:efflux RND transporter permease subunit [Pseudomonadales bacterium]MBP6229758.1 efflux RND transporter permease subunit [Pseudomonadales bacterium]